MNDDRILSETEHDAAMGRLARGEPYTWTPLVDHDTALRERLDANAALVDDLFRRLADTERAADTNAARVGELSVRLADTEAERVDPTKVAALSDALHTMVEWYHDVPYEVRRRWAAMPEVVKGYIDQFGPWLETAPWDPERFARAMRSVGYDGDAEFTEDALRAEVTRERRRGDACNRLLERAEARAERAEAARDALIAWVGQIGYPYDFTTIPPLPEQFIRPLAEWWWRDSGESGTVDEWADGIADEAQIAARAVLGEQEGGER